MGRNLGWQNSSKSICCSSGEDGDGTLDFKIEKQKRETRYPIVETDNFDTHSNPHISDKDEKQIAGFLKEELEDAGLQVSLQRVTSKPYWEFAGGRSRTRYNVIARTGKKGGKKLILNGHIDTVSGDTMDRPFDPRIVGDKMYGRGSSDMKVELLQS